MADESLPQSPPTSAKARAQDLALLREDARRYLVRERPSTDALWNALLQPRGAVLRAYRELLVQWARTDPESSQEANMAILDGEPAITGVATTLVAKALLGDQAAAHEIFTRIEGTPRQAKLDES